MGPEDGEPGAKSAPPPSTGEDAFAATVAPAPSQLPQPSSPPKVVVDHTRNVSTRASNPAIPGAEATVAAPMMGALPPLPEVSRAQYRADKEIARGGMGRIVAAEDLRLGRPVALKELLDPGGDSNTRFQREALITARLQHPGIVPVYEAGRWPSGEPFFAMKMVSGRPFDRVIADAKTLAERMVLLPRLAAACDAIAYAHSQRIVHRDLKPGNVLMGDFGETVVIDWGLAKDLDDAESPESANRSPRAQISTGGASGSSTLTVAGAVMGTPAYMPPEQARGEQVDQRADVFALGAMLYHVLAGVPPYAARTATDVIAAAALGRVTPLAERERRAPAELIAIVERAMAAEAADRYPHAGELADELRRFLNGQLVDAHRYTAVERVLRFVRKHRAAVTIAAIATVIVAVGGTIAVRRVVEARDDARLEARIATARKIAAEHLIDYTLSNMKTSLKEIGRLDLLAGLGSEIRTYFDKLAKVPGGMPPEDRLRMYEAIELIGDAEHKSGKPDQALATWKDARDKIAHIVADDRGARTFHLRKLLAKLDHELGAIAQERGEWEKAVAQLTTANQEWDALRTEQPKDRQLLRDAADTHDRLGDVLRTEGKLDPAFEEYSHAKTMREAAVQLGNSQVSDEKLGLSMSHQKLGSIYALRGESNLALEEYRAAVRLREELLEVKPDNVDIQQHLLEAQQSLADLERAAGDDAASIEMYRAALPIAAQLSRRDPTNADWQRTRASLLCDLGFVLVASGHFAEGRDQYDQTTALQKDLVARDPKSTRYKSDLARTYLRAGEAQLALGKPDDALAAYKLALELRQGLVDKEPKSVPFRRSLAWSHARLGDAYAAGGATDSAIAEAEAALAIRGKLVDESPTQGGFKNELAASEAALATLLAGKDTKRAAELAAAGLERARQLVANDPINTEWKQTLLQALLAQAAVAKAQADGKARAAALGEAHDVATEARQRAPQDVQLAGTAAEIDVALAEAATARGDGKAAAQAWAGALAALEPLAKDGRLPAPRQALLDRARARR